MHDNCYQVLGVARTASPAELRAAFVRQVKRYHPDARGQGGMRQAALPSRLQDIQAAYRLLSDPEARAEHDRILEAAEQDHFYRQRAIQRRLHRYDRRHPCRVSRPYRRVRWRSLSIASLGLSIAVCMVLQYWS